MGNSQGGKQYRRNKEEREMVNNNRKNFITFRKNGITDIETQVQNDAVQRIKNSTNDEDGVLVLNDMEKKIALLKITQIQLDREGKPFTKADLIAIIIALEPSKFAGNIDGLNDNTIPDLNTMIRLIIYDPSRYVNTGSNVTQTRQTEEPKKIKNVEESKGFGSMFFGKASYGTLILKKKTV